LLAPLNVGTSLNGADLSPDGGTLYATESQLSGGLGVIHKVNLAGGTVTNLTYGLSSLESGSWDVAVLPSGKALFDGRFAGSGWVPVHQIDPSTNAISTAYGGVRQDTQIHRSADRGEVLFTESNISSGPLILYNAAANTFSPE